MEVGGEMGKVSDRKKRAIISRDLRRWKEKLRHNRVASEDLMLELENIIVKLEGRQKNI